VIHTDLDRIFAHWAGHAGCDVAAVRDRMVFDTHYQSYERGGIGIPAYFDHLRGLLGIDLPDEVLLEGWNAIFVGEMPGIACLLERARANLPIYAFSNTNQAHVERFSVLFAPVLSHFTEVFVSSTIGLRKPEAAAFAHVAGAIGVPATRIMFFDDLAENVAGAAAVGMHAVHVTTTDEIAVALEQVGLTSDHPPIVTPEAPRQRRSLGSTSQDAPPLRMRSGSRPSRSLGRDDDRGNQS